MVELWISRILGRFRPRSLGGRPQRLVHGDLRAAFFPPRARSVGRLCCVLLWLSCFLARSTIISPEFYLKFHQE